MRTILIALLMTLATQCGASISFADENRYGSFILNIDIPDTLFSKDKIKSDYSFQLRKPLRNHDSQNIVLASPIESYQDGLQMAGMIFDKELRTIIPRGGYCSFVCAYAVKIPDWFLSQPYYHQHLMIAVFMNCCAALICAAVWGVAAWFPVTLLFGGVFYGLREVLQFTYKHWWDSKGFWWPVNGSIVCFLLGILIYLIFRRVLSNKCKPVSTWAIKPPLIPCRVNAIRRELGFG
ncbi:hypothetical protein ACMAZE_11890 [Pseudopelagicola sp. nBUS_20]|uniref:hypothetical protein n=1 Tax=Pseudopelagicola sp. nBUS_20 TaxID=3395317 RepID=UPI003EBDFB5A